MNSNHKKQKTKNTINSHIFQCVTLDKFKKNKSILTKYLKRPLFHEKTVHFHPYFLKSRKIRQKLCHGAILFHFNDPPDALWPTPLMSLNPRLPRNKNISSGNEVIKETPFVPSVNLNTEKSVHDHPYQNNVNCSKDTTTYVPTINSHIGPCEMTKGVFDHNQSTNNQNDADAIEKRAKIIHLPMPTDNEIHSHFWTSIDCLDDDSSLPYLNIMLGDNNKQQLPLQPAVDSGSTHNYLAKQLFEKVHDYNKYVVKKVLINVKTGNGRVKSNATLARIPISVRDVNDNEYIFVIPTFVVDFLHDEMFIGSSFIFKSKLFSAMAADALHYVDQDNKGIVKFPLTWKPASESINLLLAENLVLAPGQSVFVETYAKRTVNNDEDLVISDICHPADDDDNDFGTYKIFPSVTKCNQDNIYGVLIKNNSSDHYHFDCNTPIAKMDYISKQTTFQNLQTLEGEPMPDLHLSYVQEHALHQILTSNANEKTMSNNEFSASKADGKTMSSDEFFASHSNGNTLSSDEFVNTNQEKHSKSSDERYNLYEEN